MNRKFYSIIIPIRNQEKTVQKNLIKLIRKLKKIKFLYKWEIILVDDCSADKTIKKISQFKTKYKNIRLVKNFKNRGKGYSIKKGIKFLNKKSEKVITIDADMPYMETFNKFMSNLKENDLVILNRKDKNSKLINKNKNFYIYYRIFVGYFLNLVFRIFKLTSLKDTQAGLKGFNSSFRKIFRYIKTDGFLYDLEFLLILEKKKIYPKQISCKYYVSDKSSITLNYSVYKKIFLDLLKIILNRLRKKYDLEKNRLFF